jgi:glycosyltransferase involved in cell wall biosynthesis
MKNKLLSIIIPCYNVEEFIAEAVESALSQTYPNKEVVVVNDGSTDNSLKVLSRFGDQIRIITKKNGGLSSARNTGVLYSGGEYVMFLDADDIISPESAQAKIDILESNPDVGLVVGRHEVLTEDGLEPGFWSNQYEPVVEDPFPLIFFVNAVVVDPIYRREVFAHCGLYDAFFDVGEDSEFYIRVAARYSIAFHDKVYSFYRRIKSRSTLSTKKVQAYKADFFCFKKVISFASPHYEGKTIKKWINAAIVDLSTGGILDYIGTLPLMKRPRIIFEITAFNILFPLQSLIAKVRRVYRKLPHIKHSFVGKTVGEYLYLTSTRVDVK